MAEAFGFSSGIRLCQGILDYYRVWKNAQNDVQSMYTSTEALTRTFTLLKLSLENKRFSRNVVANVEESIHSCQSEIEHLKRKLDKVQDSCSG
jgi:hypothetical protein